MALVDDSEWEALGEAAGLHLRFTGGECQDAWEQLWHDRALPGVEVYTFLPLLGLPPLLT